KEKMVVKAEQYTWSSYAAKIGLIEDDWLDLDPCYLSLAKTLPTCRKRDEEFVGAGISRAEQNFIRDAVERNQLTSSRRFVDEVADRLGVRIEFRGRGRPVKAESSDSAVF